MSAKRKSTKKDDSQTPLEPPNKKKRTFSNSRKEPRRLSILPLQFQNHIFSLNRIEQIEKFCDYLTVRYSWNEGLTIDIQLHLVQCLKDLSVKGLEALELLRNRERTKWIGAELSQQFKPVISTADSLIFTTRIYAFLKSNIEIFGNQSHIIEKYLESLSHEIWICTESCSESYQHCLILDCIATLVKCDVETNSDKAHIFQKFRKNKIKDNVHTFEDFIQLLFKSIETCLEYEKGNDDDGKTRQLDHNTKCIAVCTDIIKSLSKAPPSYMYMDIVLSHLSSEELPTQILVQIISKYDKETREQLFDKYLIKLHGHDISLGSTFEEKFVNVYLHKIPRSHGKNVHQVRLYLLLLLEMLKISHQNNCRIQPANTDSIADITEKLEDLTDGMGLDHFTGLIFRCLGVDDKKEKTNSIEKTNE